MSYVENALSKITGLLFRGAAVRRCHTHVLSHENTVGSHSFRVMLLYWQLSHNTIGFKSLVAEAILLHDIAECVTGDIPAQMKKKLTKNYPNDVQYMEENFLRTIGFPHVNEYALLSNFEEEIVKIIDALDLVILCWEERFQHGNHSLYDMHHRAWQYFSNRLLETMRIPGGRSYEEIQFLKDCQSLGQKFICTTNGEGHPEQSFGNIQDFYHE